VNSVLKESDVSEIFFDTDDLECFYNFETETKKTLFKVRWSGLTLKGVLNYYASLRNLAVKARRPAGSSCLKPETEIYNRIKTIIRNSFYYGSL